MGFKVKVLSPSRPVADVEAKALQVPAFYGEMEIMPGHAPMIAEVAIGRLAVIKSGQETLEFFISGGYLEADNESVTVMADVIESRHEIDLDRAKSALKRAESRLSTDLDYKVDIDRALKAKKRAESRCEFASLK